ncbi:MAG TPA: phosphatidate cytidylyltransferase [Acidobacteriota bacterium]|nr:phosphatidate cytidylyltransferase [Acidobacteriota bacterium]
MILRTATALGLILMVLAALFWLPFFLFLLFIDAFILLALLEFFRLHPGREYGLLAPTLGLNLLWPWIWNYFPWAVLPFLFFSVMVLLTWTMIRETELRAALGRASTNLFSMHYIGLPMTLASAYQVHSPSSENHPERPFLLLLALLAVWLCDSGAYFVGRFLGRRKVTPGISPGKTLEGFVAGLVLPALAIPALSGEMSSLPAASPIYWAGFGLTVAAAAILGDLFESTLKRGAGAKDSGRLFPGHGGVLDRIDSLLFAFPAFYLYTLALA